MTHDEMIALMFNPYLGRRGDATAELRTFFLNNTVNELSLAFFFDTLETLSTTLNSVDGTASYVYPAGEYHIDTMRDLTNGFDLDNKDWDWYNRTDQGEDVNILATGIPLCWVVYQGQIYLSPTPNDIYNYRVAGRKFPLAMSSVQQVCGLPEDWHLIAVMSAAADLLVGLGNTVRGHDIKNEALAKISAKQELRTIRRIQQVGQVHVQRKKPGGGGIHYRRGDG